MSENVFIQEFERSVPTGDAVPIAPAPSRLRLVSGVVQCEIEEVTPGLSSKQSLYQVATTLRVTQPAEYAGVLIWETFVIGDKQDPQAEQPETWGRTIGGSRFRRLADRAKVPFGKMSTMAAALLKKPVIADMYTFTEPALNKDGSKNDYAGKTKRRVRDFFAVNEKTLSAKGVPFDDASPAAAGSVTFDPTTKVTCPICTTVVTAAEFPGHAETHES